MKEYDVAISKPEFPKGILALRGDRDGALWLGNMYQASIAKFDPANIEDPQLGSQMLYTSGTTGRPKGVFRPHGVATPPQFTGSNANYDPDTDVQLCVGPGYHAAPLAFDIAIAQASGVPTVFIGEKWDS